MKTSEKIIEYIKKNEQATGSELADFLELSDRAIRKQLASLLEKKVLIKIGKPPRVYYLIKKKEMDEKIGSEIDIDIKKKIDERYLIITPTGERKAGFEGFVYWCRKQSLPIEKTANGYLRTIEKYNSYIKGGLIDGTSKIKNTFGKLNLNKIYYLDFYSIERFGKTKLGQLLLYAKQSQDKKLMKELIAEIKPRINMLIENFAIDGIGFIPPTVKREVQLMKILEKGLIGGARSVKIVKIKTEVAVPQKTLSKLNDRILNAKNTFVVEENSSFENILLIDDAVGSGATMNEIARKIKNKKICKGQIIGLAITGSFKGFDVISEV